MSAFLLVLLLLSLALALLVLLAVLPTTRARFRTLRSRRLLGLLQLGLGALWVAFGAAYLADHGRSAVGGWYAIALGLVCGWQALRRLAPARRR
jgi:hypothetical protein